VTLFPTSAQKPKGRALRDREVPIQIPTGSPRLVESSSARRARARQDAWSELIAAVRRSSDARLELLRGRAGSDFVPCPWERLTSCRASCRCCGEKLVTVDFLRRHYTDLSAQIALVARPSLHGRSS
jgi:hypothetical protein